MKELLWYIYPRKTDTRKALKNKLIGVSIVVIFCIHATFLQKWIYKEDSYITIPLKKASIEYLNYGRGEFHNLLLIHYENNIYAIHRKEYNNFYLLDRDLYKNSPKEIKIIIYNKQLYRPIITAELDNFIYDDKIIKNEYAYKTTKIYKSMVKWQYFSRYFLFFYFLIFLFAYFNRKKNV